MPLYEYQCRQCGKQYEELIFGDAKPECPVCKSKDAEKLMSVVAVGSGRPEAPPSPCGSCPGAGSCGMR